MEKVLRIVTATYVHTVRFEAANLVQEVSSLIFTNL